jgi:hypothetical protein
VASCELDNRGSITRRVVFLSSHLILPRKFDQAVTSPTCVQKVPCCLSGPVYQLL